MLHCIGRCSHCAALVFPFSFSFPLKSSDYMFRLLGTFIVLLIDKRNQYSGVSMIYGVTYGHNNKISDFEKENEQ